MSASGIEVAGRQVTSPGIAAVESLRVPDGESRCRPSRYSARASSRLLSDIDRWLARAIWLAAWFQWTLALPSQNGASAVCSIGARRSGPATERLDGVEIIRVGVLIRPRGGPGSKLSRAGENERCGEGQPLRAHAQARGRPAAASAATGRPRSAAERRSRCALNPSVARHASTACATSIPQAMPAMRAIGRRPRYRRSAPRATPHSASSAALAARPDGKRPTSAVYAAAMTAARRDAPWGAVS